MASESRLELSWSEIAAGAIAALSGAVTASVLGVYGTLMGAGIMSVVTTVVATISHHYLNRTRRRLRQVRYGADGPASAATHSRVGAISRLRRWKKLAGGSLLVAGSAVATVTAVQLLAQEPFTQMLFGADDPTRQVIVKRIVVDEGADSADLTAASTSVSGDSGGQVNQGGDHPEPGNRAPAGPHTAEPTPDSSSPSPTRQHPDARSSPELDGTTTPTERSSPRTPPATEPSPEDSTTPTPDPTGGTEQTQEPEPSETPDDDSGAMTGDNSG